MNIVSKNGLLAYQFENNVFSHCHHGIFTRHGGVSLAPWLSLNQGGTVGDEKNSVIINRTRAFEFFDRKVESIFDVWQVHSTTTICTEEPRELEGPHIKADAIFTNNPKITLFMRFADCVPIMIFEPNAGVVGIIHAGWKGTVNKIVTEALNTIQDHYSVNPKDIVAGIGPSIGPDHYIVGEEICVQIEKSFGEFSQNLIEKKGRKIHFDLWKANEFLLKQHGVESIESSRICTACHIEDWYSHRAENGSTGRFGALIALKE